MSDFTLKLMARNNISPKDAKTGKAYLIEFDAEDAVEASATSPGNRRICQKRVERYSLDIKKKAWLPGNDAILFDKSGCLRNGHHRCAAIMLAGTPAPLLVRFYVADDEFLNIDGPKVRNLEDATAFNEDFPNITSADDSFLRSFLSQGGFLRSELYSQSYLVGKYNKYKNVLDTTNDLFKGFRTLAAVKAAFARAIHNSADMGVIRSAATVLNEGIIPGLAKDQPIYNILRLRDFINSNRVKGGKKIYQDIYRKTTNMLKCTVDGDICGKVTATRTRDYPIPEDAEKQIQGTVDYKFVAAVNYACKELRNGQKISPKEIANMMIDNGFKSYSKNANPAKSIAGRFVTLLKKSPDKIVYGQFLPAEPASMRINNYVFHRKKKETDILKSIRNTEVA